MGIKTPNFKEIYSPCDQNISIETVLSAKKCGWGQNWKVELGFVSSNKQIGGVKITIEALKRFE